MPRVQDTSKPGRSSINVGPQVPRDAGSVNNAAVSANAAVSTNTAGSHSLGSSPPTRNIGRSKVTAISGADLSNEQAFFEEEISRYTPGGYHPVRIGNAFANGKYKVLSKLGYGQYSTVWLAYDMQKRRTVALKILTSDSYGNKKDPYELDILDWVSKRLNQSHEDHHILGVIDKFHHDGPNGRHICLVFNATGPHLERFRGLFPKRRLPIPTAKKVSRDLVKALAFLHDECGVIHTDIKPTNILIETSETLEMLREAPPEIFAPHYKPLRSPRDFYMKSEPVVSAYENLATTSDVSFRLADFGTSSWAQNHFIEWIQPEKLRAPEVILRAGWGTKADIWNLGTVIFELVTGEVCFTGLAPRPGATFSLEAHLAEMQSIFGRFPESLLGQSSFRDKFFDSKGNLRSDVSFPASSLQAKVERSGAFADKEDMADFVDFLQTTIALEPKERSPARKLLHCRWLKEEASKGAAAK